LGTRYLDGVLSLIRRSNPAVPGDIDTSRSQVTPEKRIGCAPGKDGRLVGCDCDIVVTCPDHVIFIEHKIKSGESPNPNSHDRQLQRYDVAIEGNPEFGDLMKIRIYLTPEGNGKSGLSEWSGLSHRELAEVGMSVLRDEELSKTARENLKRFIIDVLLGPYEKAENEVRQLERLAKDATTSAAFVGRLRFDQAVSRNQLLVDLLMEGLS
jgi:hypothetical protein